MLFPLVERISLLREIGVAVVDARDCCALLWRVAKEQAYDKSAHAVTSDEGCRAGAADVMWRSVSELVARDNARERPRDGVRIQVLACRT